MKRVLLIVFVIFFSACSDSEKVPAGILSTSRMEALLQDLYLADALVNDRKNRDTLITEPDLLKRSYYEQLFKLHNTNREAFLKSYRYYVQHPVLFKKITDSLASSSQRSADAIANDTTFKP